MDINSKELVNKFIEDDANNWRVLSQAVLKLMNDEESFVKASRYVADQGIIHFGFFAYYEDTRKFFIDNHYEIYKYIKETSEEIGVPLLEFILNIGDINKHSLSQSDIAILFFKPENDIKDYYEAVINQIVCFIGESIYSMFHTFIEDNDLENEVDQLIDLLEI